jgi:hypothetical protein
MPATPTDRAIDAEVLAARRSDPDCPEYYEAGGKPPAVRDVAPLAIRLRLRKPWFSDLDDAVKALAESTRQYQDLAARGADALADFNAADPYNPPCRTLAQALALAHHRVRFDKGTVQALTKALAGRPRPCLLIAPSEDP